MYIYRTFLLKFIRTFVETHILWPRETDLVTYLIQIMMNLDGGRELMQRSKDKFVLMHVPSFTA